MVRMRFIFGGLLAAGLLAHAPAALADSLPFYGVVQKPFSFTPPSGTTQKSWTREVPAGAIVQIYGDDGTAWNVMESSTLIPSGSIVDVPKADISLVPVTQYNPTQKGMVKLSGTLHLGPSISTNLFFLNPSEQFVTALTATAIGQGQAAESMQGATPYGRTVFICAAMANFYVVSWQNDDGSCSWFVAKSDVDVSDLGQGIAAYPATQAQKQAAAQAAAASAPPPPPMDWTPIIIILLVVGAVIAGGLMWTKADAEKRAAQAKLKAEWAQVDARFPRDKFPRLQEMGFAADYKQEINDFMALIEKWPTPPQTEKEAQNREDAFWKEQAERYVIRHGTENVLRPKQEVIDEFSDKEMWILREYFAATGNFVEPHRGPEFFRLVQQRQRLVSEQKRYRWDNTNTGNQEFSRLQGEISRHDEKMREYEGKVRTEFIRKWGGWYYGKIEMAFKPAPANYGTDMPISTAHDTPTEDLGWNPSA